MSVGACVNCSNEEVEKVSAVHNNGAWSSSSHGARHGVRFDKRGRPVFVTEPFSEQTKGATHLAEMLAPPQQPVNVAVLMILVICSGLLFILWLMSALVLQALIGWTGGSIVGIVVALFALGMIYEPAKRVSDRQTRRHEEKLAAWKTATDRWDNLYYCSRCDHVFDPERAKAASARNMSTLL